MSAAGAGDASRLNANQGGQEKLPRRDWILLPLTAFFCVAILAVLIEMISERLLTKNNVGGENCMIFNDPGMGSRGIPNCECQEKILDSSTLVEYRFNRNGYRDDSDFGPKAPGTYRIAMIGTSVAAGFRVPEQQTIAALLPKELSRRTGLRVELYNEAMPFRSPQMIARNFDSEVLATKPDLVLWILVSADIANQNWNNAGEANPALALHGRALIWYRIQSSLKSHSLTAEAQEIFDHSRTSKLLKLLLYRSPSLYVNASMAKMKPPAELQQDLQLFDKNTGAIAEEARNAGVPVVAALIPYRQDVATISLTGEWPAGVDPYEFGSALRPVITSHGWSYIDLLPDFRTVPNPQLEYFALDGHPNAQGHATMTDILAEHLTDGSIPRLAAANQGQTAAAQGSHR